MKKYKTSITKDAELLSKNPLRIYQGWLKNKRYKFKKEDAEKVWLERYERFSKQKKS